jgi:glycerate 2-kinase
MHHPSDNPAAAHALAIYRTALDAVRADRLVLDALRRDGDMLHVGDRSVDLTAFEHVFVVGAGKAAAGMAQAAEERLGEFLTEGVVVTKYGHADAKNEEMGKWGNGEMTSQRPSDPTTQRPKMRVMEAAHPVPDAASVEAGRAIRDLAARAGENDLVLCLLSGGASALMELPQEGITLDDLRATTDLLLRAGAVIEELNAVRACLSQLKAGGLARAARPAQVLCLVLSDVLGNPLHVIASGPCMETPVDHRAAQAILKRYDICDAVPTNVNAHLVTLSPCHPVTSSPPHVIIGDIWTALRAARDEAARRGLRSCILTGWVTGEAREVGKVFGGIARDLPRALAETGTDCYIAGGETTVTVRGKGRGGRSQEIACAAAPLLAGVENVALLAAGTDGTDGPTDAAGGLTDGGTLARAREKGLSVEAALRENDAYPFLEAVGGLLKTGPTFSNVGDLILMVAAHE